MIKPMVRAVMRALFRVLFRVRIEGDQSSLRLDRLLLVANHESLLDGLLLALFLPVHPVFVIHSGVINNRFFRALIQARLPAHGARRPPGRAPENSETKNIAIFEPR